MTDLRPSTEQRAWISAAQSLIRTDRISELAVGAGSIPSPTGEEAPLAEWLVDQLRRAGITGEVQPLDDRQANAVGSVKGAGDGHRLLLYAPIDTLTVGDPIEDVPNVGASLRADMVPDAKVDGDYVIGLGASNPKGHAVAILAAAEAIAAANVPLRGDLLLGFGAGGMPRNGRLIGDLCRRNAGQGVGCSFMLEQGIWPDHAVVAKPGWSVAWEEVGLCWFEITVHGTFTYVGSRHRMPYRNCIADAATVVTELEQWFPQYATRHTGGLVAPQGIVSAVEGGWMTMAAVAPEQCRVLVDLRISARTSPAQARREFGAALADITARHPDITLDWRQVLAIPGSETSRNAFVVAAAVQAWEDIMGRPHELIVETSGATDANILRNRGIPTARIGMDRIGPDAPMALDFPSGQNVLDVREAARLARHLVHTAVNVCTRKWSGVD